MRSALGTFVRFHAPTPLPLLLSLLVLAPGCDETKEPEAEASEASEAEEKAKPQKDEAQEAGGKNRGKGEHRGRKGKWKEPGVYVDGEPVGFIKFAELPLSLEPTWVEGEMDVEFKAGEPAPPTEKVKYRRYRLAEYLEKVGVNLRKVKEVHIYGGYFAGRLTGRDLRRARDRIYFGFGRTTHGKALFYPPRGVNIGTSFDSIAAVAVYIDKKPPKILESAEVEFKGEVTAEIPYFGKPLRGGVRVYKDDHLATVIKRRKLENDDELAYWEGEELRWKMRPFLEAQGVKTSDVVTAEIIYTDRRVHRLSGDELRGTFFVATPQKRGEVVLGEEKRPVEALALYTKKLPPIDPEDVRYQE